MQCMALENNGNRYYSTNQDVLLYEFALFHLWRNPYLNRDLYDDLVEKVSSELQQGHVIDPSKLISNFRKNHCQDDQLRDLYWVVREERSFWEHMLQHCQPDERASQLALMAFCKMSLQFRLDEGLMSKACILEELLLHDLDPSLKSNRAFVQKVLLGNPLALQEVYSAIPEPDLLGCMDGDLLAEVLKLNPVALRYVSHDHQRLYLDAVKKAFGQLGLRQQQLDRDACFPIANSIAPDLWQNRDILLLWFRSGLPFTATFEQN